MDFHLIFILFYFFSLSFNILLVDINILFDAAFIYLQIVKRTTQILLTLFHPPIGFHH